MCVIMVATTKRPSEDMLRKGHDQNPAGSGLAWRDGKFVHWTKGLEDIDEMVELCAQAPLPFVVHFRIPTVGGKVKELCHPFPVTRDVGLGLKGKTDGFVMFHNGHWGAWKTSSLEAAIKNKIKVPNGKWSDSRAMAWSAHLYGVGVLEFIDEKACAFSPTEIEVFGSGWSQVDEVWVSNRNWENRTYHTSTPHSMGGGNKHRDNPAPTIMGPVAKADNEAKGSGGDRAEIPFTQVLADYRAGRITKSQYKKRKKEHEARTRKALRQAERLARTKA